MIRILVRVFAVVGVLTVVGFVAGTVALVSVDRGPPEVPDNAVVTLDLRGSIGGSDAPLAALAGEPLEPAQVQAALERAARDERVSAVLARVDGRGQPPAMAAAIRDGLAALRQAGKSSFAFADSFGELGNGTRGYALATAFDEIRVQPGGLVGLTGLATDVPFFAELLEAAGVSADFTKRAEFKTAMASFSESDMAKPHRRMLESLHNDFFEQITGRIAERRDLTAAQVRAAVDAAPLTGEEAVQRGLVDELDYGHGLQRSAMVAAGDGAQKMPLPAYFRAWQARQEVPASPAIAVIDGSGPVVRGRSEADPLGDRASLGADTLVGAVEAALEDNIAGIILRLDTPGGSAVAAERVRRGVARAREAGVPVAVAMANTAASGGYWIAAGAGHISARPATLTGSIGVLAGKFATRELWQELDVNWAEVSRGANAGMFSPVRDFTPEQRDRLEGLVDHTYEQFIDVVAEGRDMAPDAVRAVAKGRVWTGRQARERGLVDDLDGFHGALAWTKRQIGVAPEQAVNLQPYPAPKTPIDQLMAVLRGQGPVSAGLATYRRLFAAAAAEVMPLMAPAGEHRVRLDPAATR